MDRSRAVIMAVLVAAPSALAAPRRRVPPQKPAPAAPTDPAGVRTTLPDPEVAPPPGSTHPEGEYGGVSPDAGHKPDKPQKRPPPGTLSWIGFTAKDGGAEIFLQSVAAFELTQHVEGSTLVIDVPLSRMGHNTWRDVDTRFFDSPIAHIIARYVGAARATKVAPAHRSGIEVRIAFKSSASAHEAAVRTATEADGMYYAYLSFAGTAASAAPDADK